MNRLDVLRTATREEVNQLTNEELQIFYKERHRRFVADRHRRKREELKNNANAKKGNN